MAERQRTPTDPGSTSRRWSSPGRADVLDGAEEALDIAAYDGRTPRPLILLGPRGVGKTVTLGEISELAAERHDWPSVHVEAKVSGPFMTDLVAGLRGAGRLLAGDGPDQPQEPDPGDRREGRGIAFGVGGEIQFDKEPRDEQVPNLGATLAETMRIATGALCGPGADHRRAAERRAG